jgi:hypothetical protein
MTKISIADEKIVERPVIIIERLKAESVRVLDHFEGMNRGVKDLGT